MTSRMLSLEMRWRVAARANRTPPEREILAVLSDIIAAASSEQALLRRRWCRGSTLLGMALTGTRRVRADDAVKRTALVAVPIKPPDEVAAVLVAESNRDVLGGHLEDVDHVPAGEVAGGEVQASLPS